MTVALSHPIRSNVVGDPAAPRRVVFLHGLFGRGRNFSSIASRLEPEIQSLLVDLPNHGQSGWTEHFDYEQMADLVAEHLRSDFAAAGPVDLVGHSMGGKVAMVLALRHPDLVRRLVVVDISPVDAGSSRGNFHVLLDALASVDLASISRRGEAEEYLQPLIPQDGTRLFLMQNLRRRGEEFTWEPNLQLLRSELATVTGFPDVTGREFTGPVLWMRGEHSDYVTDDDGPAMRAYFPKTVRITVNGAGHWVHAEQPDAFVTALRTFILSDDRS